MRPLRLFAQVLAIGAWVNALSSAPVLAAEDHAAADRETRSRPNILLLLSDDHRADAIGAYGNPRIETPHLDRLVDRGHSFRCAYCMGSMHGAVCQPSRAMLLSGRTLYRAPLDLAGVETVPESLARAGYATFATGKWHNGRPSLARAFQRAQSVFFGGMSDHTRVPVVDLLADGQFSPPRVAEKFSSETFADAAIAYLGERAQNREQPFFAYVAFTSPHDPRQPPPEYAARYDAASMQLPANFLPQHPFNNGWLVGRDENLAPWPRTPEVVRAQLAEYYGMITHLDAQIGRVISALEANGQADNTIVVFASDHGLALGSHGLLGKQSVYEHSMQSPLVIAGPGVPRGESRELVYLLDLFPTLCDLAGAAPAEGIEGRSLAAIWRGDQFESRSTLFLAFEDGQRAVRDRRWKLIRYPRIHYTQLFDLDADPHETINLAESADQTGRVAQLTTELSAWQSRVGDTAPLTAVERQPADIDLTGRARQPDDQQPPDIVRKYFGD